MSALITPLVEDHLPRQFIYDLGLYLQTCSHIEVATCSLICTLEKLDQHTDTWRSRFHLLRKEKTSDLIKTLRKAARSLPEKDNATLDEFIKWIEELIRYRHLISHGAFYSSQPEGPLKVLYTHRLKSSGVIQHFPEEMEFDRALILELIQTSDECLRIISGLNNLILKQEIILKI